MTCTKTGCHIWIEPYSMWAYGDAFEVEINVPVPHGTEVARFAYFKLVRTAYEVINNMQVKHYTVHNFEEWIGNKFLETEADFDPVSVLITTDFTNHGYNGVAI